VTATACRGISGSGQRPIGALLVHPATDGTLPPDSPSAVTAMRVRALNLFDRDARR
jgi:hypothetical protein